MRMLAVARFTLLRLRRSRYPLAGLLLAALVMLIQFFASGHAAGVLHLTQQLGWFITWLASIWLGITVVQADRADGSLRSTLTRPISLVEALLGKLLGAWLYVVLLSAALTLAINGALLIRGGPVTWSSLTYQVHMLPVHLTVAALALLLAQMLPRFAAGMIMLFAWDESVLSWFADRADGMSPFFADLTLGLGRFLHTILPPVSKFYLPYTDYAARDLPNGVYLLLLVFAAHYVVAACLLAAWALSRQEL